MGNGVRDRLHVLRVAPELARPADGAGHRADRGPHRRQARVAASPVRGVGGQRQQHREGLDQAPERADRGLAVGDGDVNAEGHGRVRRDRVHARRGSAQAQRGAERAAQRRTQARELVGRTGDRRVPCGSQLDDRAPRPRGSVPCDLGVEDVEQVREPVGRPPAARVEEHRLLLDCDGPRTLGGGLAPDRPPRELTHSSAPSPALVGRRSAPRCRPLATQSGPGGRPRRPRAVRRAERGAPDTAGTAASADRRGRRGTR
jgi:hypothetical protein